MIMVAMSPHVRRRWTGAAVVPTAPVVDRVARGRVRVGRVRGRDAVMALEVHSPLRVLVPRIERSVWLFASTVNGGLAGGDRVAIDLSVEADTRALLSSATGQLVEAGDRAAHSDLRATVAPGAVLALLTDPVTCAAGSHYEQKTEIDLADGGSAAVLDVFDGGSPSASGPRWAMGSLRCDLSLGGVRDTMLLDAAHGDIARRLGRFGAIGRLVLAGPAFAAARERIVAGVKAGAAIGASCVETTSARGDVLVLRLAADSLESATARLRAHLAEVVDQVGDPSA